VYNYILTYFNLYRTQEERYMPNQPQVIIAEPTKKRSQRSHPGKFFKQKCLKI
jgi:hypothetical protein